MATTPLTPASTGQWALVVGGSSGIGRAYAVALAKRGFDIIAVGRHRGRLDQTAADLRDQWGADVHTVAVDLSDATAGRALIDALGDREVGVYVTTAGEGKPGQFVDGDVDAYAGTINVKVRTLMEVTHHVAADMRERGRGAIQLVSSIGGLQGVGALANNAAAEAYVLSLGEALHRELGPHGVTVSVLMPGATRTPGLFAMVPDPAKHPRGTMSPEATVAEGIDALERGQASHIAGASNRVMMRLLPRRARIALVSRMLGALFERSAPTPAKHGGAAA